MRNVVDFQSRAGLHRAFMPERNTSGSAWIDFVTFWQLRFPLMLDGIDWWGALSLGLMAVSGALVVVGILGMASCMAGIDLSALFNVSWKQ